MNSKTKRRLLSGVLMFSMLASLLPVGVAPVEAAGENVAKVEKADSSKFDDILDMGSKQPDGFDPQGTENPYGYPKDQPFMLNPHDELALYQTVNVDEGGRKWTTWYDTWEGEGKSINLARTDSEQKGGFNKTNSFADTKSASFVEEVAFDPNGTGRKDHIAYFGYVPVANCLSLWVVDTTQHDKKYVYDFPMSSGSDNWLEKDNLWYSFAANYFAITAGDYNGDGKESLVAFLPNDKYNYGLVEVELSGGCLFASESGIKNMLNPKYVGEGHGQLMANDNTYYNKICCDLESGDFNRDGIDDLAVLSYLNKPYGDSGSIDLNNLDMAYYSPWLRVAFGGKQGSYRILNQNNKSDFVQIRKQEQSEPDYTHYKSMVAPSMSVGDVDGDNTEELVIAGHKNIIESKKNSADAESNFNIDTSQIEIAVFNTEQNGKLSDFTLKEVASNAWSAGGFMTSSSWYAWQPIGLECVAFNGSAAAEYLFIDGTIYDGQNFQELFTPEYFKEKDDSMSQGTSWDISATFIPSAAPGNYDNNDYGYEQIIYVVALERQSYNEYSFLLGIIGGKNYGEKGGPVGGQGGTDQEKFYSTMSNEYLQYCENANVKECLNVVLTPMDRDGDGQLAKYVGKCYTYSDPKVLAVLQAAPYFGELGDNYLGDNYGETTYSFTQSYETSHGESDSGSIGLGATTSLEGTIGSIDMTLKQENAWSTGFEESWTKSYTTSFSAGGYDSVVVYRTPVFIYNYMFWDPENKCWGDGKKKLNNGEDNDLMLSISVPQVASYFQMSVPDYNAFAKDYNKVIEKKNEGITDEKKKAPSMKEINLSYLGQKGNPWGYSESMEPISKHHYQLGYNGGSTTSASTDGKATSESITHSHGFSFDMTAQFGFDAGFVSSMAGPTGSISYMHDYSDTNTKSSETETSGTVMDLDSHALIQQEGIPKNVIEGYGFTWELAKAYIDLGAAGDIATRTKVGQDGKVEVDPNNNTLVIGYKLSGIKAPAPMVDDLDVTLTGDNNVNLSWTKPNDNGRLKVNGYNVYKKTKNGKFEKVTFEPITATNYTVENLTSNEEYIFAVTTASEAGESVWSNRVNLTTPKKNVPLTLEYDHEKADVKATHIGNIPINSGDRIPEESLVTIEATALGDNTITKIIKTEGNSAPEEVTSVDGRFSFIMKEATKIKVETAPRSYNSFVTLEQPGTGGTFKASLHGGLEVFSGSQVTEPILLEALPSPGFALEQWIIDGSPVQANGKNTMTFKPSEKKHTISAEFVSVEDPSVARTITVNPAVSGGTLTVTDVNGNVLQPNQDNKIKVLIGTPITITATPNEYYKISKWTEALANQPAEKNTVQLEMSDSMTIGVEFIPRAQFEVAFSSDGKGSITAQLGDKALNSPKEQVNPGSNIDFKAVATDGYRVKGWTIQKGNSQQEETVLDTLEKEASYQLDNVLSPATVKANFVKIAKYNITFSPGEGGGSMNSQPAIEMTPFTLPEPANTLVAPEDQEFKCWKIGDQEINPDDQYTFTDDTTVTAQWKPLPKHQITFVAGDGKGDAITQEAVHNKEFALPSMPEGFVAPEDMEFAGWKIGEADYQVGASVQFTDATTVIAQWKPLPKVTITFKPGAGKGEETTQEVVVNKEVALPNVPASFNAPSGKVFDCWKIGDKTYSVGDTVQFNEETTVIAQWKDQPSGGGVLPKPPVKPDVPDSEVLPDGTTVETETKPDGTKIETTTKVDGSQNIKETKPDGSSKTTINNKDGSQSTTTESPEGLMETKVQIPKELAEKAAEKKENIVLPMPQAKVPSAQDKAPIINIDLGTKTKTNVVIPAESIPPGAVAYIVNEDGTKEVIRKSGINKDGILVPIEGKTTIMICDNAQKFNDLDGHWGENAAAFASSHELFNGTGNGNFSPDTSMTRGMVATVLHNLENNPQATTETTFGDVDKDAWYADGINWAAEKGIVAGTSEGNFAPNESVTREQLAVMLYRYAGEPKVADQQMNFPDANNISDFAKDAMIWATEQGIMNGTSEGMLNPQSTATRAEVATMLMNFVNGMK